MTPQEIAIQLSKIDWTAIEVDNAYETEKLRHIALELLKLDKKDMIKVLLSVMEGNNFHIKIMLSILSET